MKICIIGNSLTSIILAKNLAKKKISIDLIYKKKRDYDKSDRTIGITDNNLNLIRKYISEFNYGFPISEIKILDNSNFPNELISFKNDLKNQMHMFKYKEIYNQVQKKLFNLKNVKIKKKSFKNLSGFKEEANKYDLLIDTELDSIYSKKYFSKKIVKDYDSEAIITIIRHKKIKNNIAYQIFTECGPLAFLPLSLEKTSIVFSLNNNKKISNDLIKIKKLIKKFNPKYKILEFGKFEKFKLKMSLLKKYYKDNILAFGDRLHTIHPLAGQGFNMSIRDIEILTNLISDKIKLGLPIDNSVAKEFEKKSKFKNIIFGTSIDVLNDIFKIEKKIPYIFKKNIFKFLNNSNLITRYFSNLADKGLN